MLKFKRDLQFLSQLWQILQGNSTKILGFKGEVKALWRGLRPIDGFIDLQTLDPAATEFIGRFATQMFHYYKSCDEVWHYWFIWPRSGPVKGI